MTDPWEAILTSLEPDYEKYKSMLESGPRYCAELSKNCKVWVITVKELVYEDSYIDITPVVDWTTEQLENWPDVRRMAYDQWYFKTKHDALKFQTLFYLKWAG